MSFFSKVFDNLADKQDPNKPPVDLSKFIKLPTLQTENSVTADSKSFIILGAIVIAAIFILKK